MVVPFAWVLFALVAMIATLSVTELVRVFAHRLRAVDRPGGRRVHRRPTARLGGLGIYWGFYVALGLATYGHPYWRDAFRGDDFGMIGMMVGSSLLLIVGVMDDVYGLKATVKLGFQFCAALLLYAFGWRIEQIGWPGLGALPVGWLSLPLTLMWVLLVTNAVNLIDGLDGLASGVALVATIATCFLLAPIGGPLLLAAAALAGALLGFLWFNLNPALIFMGDAGSLFVGFLLAAMTMRAGQLRSPDAFPVVSALLLIVPLFDTADAIRRRSLIAARESRSWAGFLRDVRGRVFTPDGFHVHHRLIRAGFTTRRAVALLWAVAATFAVSACLMPNDPILGVVSVALFGLMGWRGNRMVEARAALATTMARAPVAREPVTLPEPARLPEPALVPAESVESAESQRAA